VSERFLGKDGRTMSSCSIDSGHHQPVKAVYELREAAVEHGKAVAELDAAPSRAARDGVLATQTTLEEKTVAAVDECSDNADQAVAEALEESA
jgi:hypothetical protein